ncbi:hypothetical protein EVAR_64599_1 [Eumeta japonica]|uniref:Uncharacterized protein n=1 Tax=Eumeta variegata TaxID=151549 RepID=A0A4C1Z1V9_EUMVA|nr:hypothetical protein EVAR_64599_1 [Eumeta japonica]
MCTGCMREDALRNLRDLMRTEIRIALYCLRKYRDLECESRAAGGRAGASARRRVRLALQHCMICSDRTRLSELSSK